MKKTLALFGILIVLIIFTGCGKAEDKTADQQVDQQIIQTTQQEVTQQQVTDPSITDDQIVDIEQQILLQEQEVELFEELSNKEEVSLQDCEVFTDETIKNACIDDVITTNALVQLDETICNQLAVPVDIEDCKTKVQERKEEFNIRQPETPF